MKKKFKFNVLVNPFIKTVWISSRIGQTDYEVELEYDELDEWNAFEMGGHMFDVHFYYDFNFQVSIYDDDNTYNSYPVKLKFKLTDD